MCFVPIGLHRTYGAHHLHFITCSCYRRLPFLGSARARDRFLGILEQARQRYRFVVVGYVVMPEHIHLLVTEPEVGTPSTVMQVLKQRSARALLPKRKRTDPRQRNLFGHRKLHRAFWQARFYDFNVWTTKKGVEKLRYMHRNPVKRVTRGVSRAMALEQLSVLSPRGGRTGSSESGMDRDFVSRSGGVASPLSAFPYPPLQKAQGRGTLSSNGAIKSNSVKGWATRQPLLASHEEQWTIFHI
jgi:putative transposase